MKPPDLFVEWKSAAHRYTSDEGLVQKEWAALSARYSEPHRFYHNLYHLEALFSLFGEVRGLAHRQDVVSFSLFYHDAVYEPGSAQNERKSADVAEAALIRFGVPQPLIQKVVSGILATASHLKAAEGAGDEDLYLLLDLDLSILGAPAETYRAYARNIRKEYFQISEPTYNLARVSFLQHLLQAPRIFHTDVLHGRFEAAARKNMAAEVQSLGGSDV